MSFSYKYVFCELRVVGDGLVMSYLSSAFSFIIVRDNLVRRFIIYKYISGSTDKYPLVDNISYVYADVT